jgi:Tfp pilus assembly protein PilX
MKKILKNTKADNSRGFAGIIALLAACSLVLILTFSLSASLFTKKQISRNLLNSLRSYYLAESGTEDAVLRVLKDYNYTAVNSFTLDNASIVQNITQSGRTTNIETSSSYSSSVRKLASSLTVTTTDVQFHYGVQVGEGGLKMENGSSVTGSGGDVGNIYSNGSIDGDVDAIITGDVIVATGMALDGNNINHQSQLGVGKIFGKKSDTVIDLGMKFVPAASGNLSQVAFFLKRSGALSDGTIYLAEDNGSGSPKTTSLASTIFYSDRIGETDYSWVNYSFSSPYSVVAGNTYWIVIDVSESNNTTKYFLIAQNAANTDISKHSSNRSAGSWLPAGGEPSGGYAFKAWIGGTATYIDKVIVGGSAYANNIKNSTITNEAHYQTIINTTAGSYHLETQDYEIMAMPISDGNINDWKSTASAGIDLSYLCNASGTELNPIVLNTGYMECGSSGFQGDGAMVLNGTVWVKGDITFGTNTAMKLSSSYGERSGVLIADSTDPAKGKITIGNNSPICGTQGYTATNPPDCNPSNGTYILILSTHTGYTDNAITIANNSNGAIYYAHNGMAQVSNGAKVKEVTAKKLLLKQNAEVTYEQGLANANFSNGPGGGWVINSWNEIE